MRERNESGPYEDIIHLPHPVSGKHPRMSLNDRAAQFSPFAALSGYDAAIRETSRLTEREVELDEDMLEQLDGALRAIEEKIEQAPEAEITWFVPDEKKEGGAYVTRAGRVKKIDDRRNALVMEDGTVIPVERIIEIEKAY